jgi:hypothetical protein
MGEFANKVWVQWVALVAAANLVLNLWLARLKLANGWRSKGCMARRSAITLALVSGLVVPCFMYHWRPAKPRGPSA